jgi:hypothetical protein
VTRREDSESLSLRKRHDKTTAIKLHNFSKSDGDALPECPRTRIALLPAVPTQALESEIPSHSVDVTRQV